MFSDPKKNIEQCGIQPGMIIADFGAGSGFYTLEAGKALAGTGKVYAIDAQKDLLVRIQVEANKENITNVDVIWGDVEKLGGTKIAQGTVSLVLICNILFQLEDKKSCIEEMKRVLMPGGRALVVDWADSFGGIGPQKAQVVTKESAQSLFESAGFAKEREVQAGSHHYGFIFKKM
jgi:ubiquinone/menaquinone biosynthesis C-methylase UbiE